MSQTDDIMLANYREAMGALALIREAVEMICEPGSLPSAEHVCCHHGPTASHEAEALVKAIYQTFTKD